MLSPLCHCGNEISISSFPNCIVVVIGSQYLTMSVFKLECFPQYYTQKSLPPPPWVIKKRKKYRQLSRMTEVSVHSTYTQTVTSLAVTESYLRSPQCCKTMMVGNGTALLLNQRHGVLDSSTVQCSQWQAIILCKRESLKAPGKYRGCICIWGLEDNIL